VRLDSPQSIRVLELGSSRERSVFVAAAPYVAITSLDWARSGKHFVAVLSSGGIQGDVWLVDLDGSARQLTHEPANVFCHDAVFAASDDAVVYSSNRAGAVNLWRQSLAGGAPVQLTRGPGHDEYPSAASGESIVFQSTRTRNELVLIEGEGRERPLLSHHAPIWAPAFSPDGSLLAFSRAEADGRWHIWLTDLGGEARQLTEGDTPTIYPRFTADGRGVLYFTWAPPFRVWLASVAEGQARPITPAAWDASYADAAPDGKRLAFARTLEGQSHVVVGLGTLPRWSPTGEWIAFTLDRSPTRGIHVVHPDGTGRRQLTEFGGWPTWFPDGRIGFIALGAATNQENFVVTLDGTPPQPLPGPHYDGNNFPFDVGPDARTLATSNSRHLGDEIWLLAKE
jgi:Tol biopolymer transport system component